MKIKDSDGEVRTVKNIYYGVGGESVHVYNDEQGVLRPELYNLIKDRLHNYQVSKE